MSETGLVAADSAADMSDPSDRLRKRFGLTPAEVRVALILADGFSYAVIAHRLSPHTVHTHIKEIHQKLGVHTNGRAAALIRSFSYQK